MAERQLAPCWQAVAARVLLDALERSGKCVNATLDPAIAAGHQMCSVPMVGDDSWLDEVSAADYVLVNGAGALLRSTLCQRLSERGKQSGFSFITVVHLAATIGLQGGLSEGVQIMAGSILQCGTRVCANVVINTGVCVDHDCGTGEHVFEGRCSVLAGVEISVGAVTGAGTIVAKNASDGVLVIGNPAVENLDEKL
jgi:acetyltransferase-like isoleucine patch superfamily enzyme